MATKVIGGIEFASSTDANGKIVYNGTFPSGRPVSISEETLQNYNDPAYVAERKEKVLAQLTDPRDKEAASAFYADAPTKVGELQDRAQTEEVTKQYETNEEQNKQDDDQGDNKQEETETNKPTSSPTEKLTAKSIATTLAGKAGNSKVGKPKDFIGLRDYNPLSEFSSYTYKISLYMMDPTQFNDYMAGDYTKVKNLKLIAQSGGINKQLDSKRAPGFELDFYIDDLEIVSYINAKETRTATNSFELKFKIYEPYGFTFVQKITQAQVAAQKNRNEKTDQTENRIVSLTEHFLITIKFYGYDQNGKLITGKDYPQADIKRSDEQAVFERGFPIKIKDFKFRLENKITVYNVTAVQVAEQVAKGTKLGVVPNNLTLSGETVLDALTGTDASKTKKNIVGLTQALNEIEKKQENVEFPNEYVIEFEKHNTIGDSLLVPKDYYVKERAPMSVLQSPAGSNERTAYKNRLGAVDKKIRTIEIPSGTPIVQVIDQVISQSDYLKNMMDAIDKEQDQKVNDSDSSVDKNINPRTLKWYVINTSTQIINPRKDEKRKDYAYKIIYKINEYEVPYVRSLYNSNTMSYYGPHKRYKYWYTGQNNEILSYEQEYNLLYNVTGAIQSDAATKNLQSASTALKSGQDANSVNSKPGDNDIVNSVKSFLYSPDDLLKFKLKVLGDPDYIMPSIGSSGGNGTKKWYGDDYTINPNSGQVFIEIYFEQAEDYNSDTGLLPHDGNIQFMNYPSELKNKIKGMTYMVTKVHSTFSKGKFEQSINGIIPEFAIKGGGEDRQSPPPTTASNNKNITPRGIAPGTTSAAKTWEQPPDDSQGVDKAVEDNRIRDEAGMYDNAFYGIGEAQPTEQGVATDNSMSDYDQSEMKRLKRQQDIAMGEGGRETEMSWYE